jgi:putative transposase
MKIRFRKGMKCILKEREFIIEDRFPNGDIQLRDVIDNKLVTRPAEDICFLIPRHQAKREYKSRLSEEVEAIIGQAIYETYLNMKRLPKSSVCDMVAIRIYDANRFKSDSIKLEMPSKATIYRRIAKLPSYEVHAARYGRRIADIGFKALKQGIAPTRPLERVDVDHTKLDLFVIDHEKGMPIGRPWLMDAYTAKERLP